MEDTDPQEGEEEFFFSEYAIDDTLDPLSRLVKYHRSDFSLQRLVLVRELCSTAQFAGFSESARVIIPLLPHFTSDMEPVVRQTLVDQLSPLAEFFVEKGGENGYSYLLNDFLPTSFELLVDKNVEVGTSALATIHRLAELVHPEHVHAHLLAVVTSLARDERAEDYRVVAAQLFNNLAYIFGPEYCSSLVLTELELLSNDSSFTVRKTVGGNLGRICSVVGEKLSEECVLQMYLSLCGDDIWGVRQACAGAVEGVSLGLSPTARTTKLMPVFQKLLEDTSRWVRNRAYESLGRLLHTLDPSDISPSMLQLFTDMAYQSENGDCELSEFCAFFFPAVTKVVGRERWSELSDAYGTLIKDVQWKVRKSLAYSLHEMAHLLGEDITEEYLLTAFEILLRDLDDIKLGVVLHVDSFLKMVRLSSLERLVPLICHVPLESENWRLRNVVAQRIGQVGLLLPPDNTSFSSIIALVLRLLDDSVMEVRASTYHPAAILLQHLSQSPHATELSFYFATLSSLRERPHYQSRQMFIYVTQQLLEIGADKLIEEQLLDGLLLLARDKVSNVRLVVDKIMRESFLTRNHWAHHGKVKAIMEALQQAQNNPSTQSHTYYMNSNTMNYGYMNPK